MARPGRSLHRERRGPVRGRHRRRTRQPAAAPHGDGGAHGARPRGRAAQRSSDPAADHHARPRWTHRQGHVARGGDAGCVRHVGVVAGGHLRERVRARQRRVEDQPRAVLRAVPWNLRRVRAQGAREVGDPVSLRGAPRRRDHSEERARRGPARVEGGAGRTAPGPGAARAAAPGRNRGAEPAAQLRLLPRSQAVGRRGGSLCRRRLVGGGAPGCLRRPATHSQGARGVLRCPGAAPRRAVRPHHAVARRHDRRGRPHGQRPLQPIEPDRPQRRVRALGAGHLRERVRQAGRRVEAQGGALLPAPLHRLRPRLGQGRQTVAGADAPICRRTAPRRSRTRATPRPTTLRCTTRTP